MWRARRAEFFCACYALKYTISMRKRQVRAIGMGDWYGRFIRAPVIRCLRVETSRYSNHQTPNYCRFCCDGQAKQLLDQLPLVEPLIENEQHVLNECPTYEEMRQTLPDHLLSAIASGEAANIYTERNGNALNRFLKASHTLRVNYMEP